MMRAPWRCPACAASLLYLRGPWFFPAQTCRACKATFRLKSDGTTVDTREEQRRMQALATLIYKELNETQPDK